MINTKVALAEYILRQLGAPSVDVELTEDQINDAIDSTIQEFSSFAFDGQLEDTVIIDVNGKGDYVLPTPITSIIKVSSGSTSSLTNFGGNYGAGYVPNMWSEQYFSSSTGDVSGIINSIMGISATQSVIDKFMGDELAFDFNSHKKRLRLFQPYSGPLVVYYNYDYIPDATDYIFDQVWVKKMAVAQCRLLQSTVVGKIDQALVGGGRINYDNMRSLAQEEIAQLKEDLQLQYAGPAPMMIS